jgi:hypothetical protein
MLDHKLVTASLVKHPTVQLLLKTRSTAQRSPGTYQHKHWTQVSQLLRNHPNSS